MQATQTLSNTITFKDFLFKDKSNRITLWIVLGLIIIHFFVFKYFYPFASYIHGDSFSYIKAADENLSINTYLIGYSKFLRLVSVFTRSDTVLVAIQYLLVQSSALLFIYSLFYFYSTTKPIKLILICFFVFNPLLLHLANLVSSDCTFLSLSLIWFAFLLWILHRPTNWLILGHAVVLFICFTLRYNALLYPFISAAVFLLAKMPILKKITGITMGLTFCALFVAFTMTQYKQITGFSQYSPFSGWQLANNAMYAYRFIDSSDRKPVPDKFKMLDNNIRLYFDSTKKDLGRFRTEAVLAGTYYMWSGSMPLQNYRSRLFKGDTISSEFKKWASMGPLYKEYGILIIKKYPKHFFRYFVLPNASKYYAPPIEFLQAYNSGKSTVNTSAIKWFNLKSPNVNTRSKTLKVSILNFYPIFSGIINLLMLFLFTTWLFAKKEHLQNSNHKFLMIAGLFWLANATFTILASSAALRFQSFPILFTTISVCILFDQILLISQLKSKLSHATSLKQNNNPIEHIPTY